MLDPSIARLSILVKGDVDGSVEAIIDVLASYDAQTQCHLDLLDFGVGAVTESDVELAENFGGTPPPLRALPLIIIDHDIDLS